MALSTDVCGWSQADRRLNNLRDEGRAKRVPNHLLIKGCL